jgi:chromosome segregation ATPase
MAMEVWMAAKEQSGKELRSRKTEVEQVEGALEQLGKQYEQLQRKVCFLLEVFLVIFNVLVFGNGTFMVGV